LLSSHGILPTSISVRNSRVLNAVENETLKRLIREAKRTLGYKRTSKSNKTKAYKDFSKSIETLITQAYIYGQESGKDPNQSFKA
jgi:hypothetical protein